ncbi:hypothetical protein SAMN05444388_1122 [Flavobacterium johnsoniae]|uniref:Uncharacterized protein n=1 Tax=Flavobacterium johnsoniae TaxID=986 RepID=A0A1M5TQI0_FLAJO|nr:hypothetical protein SAMN05444388_1122 [Flavobacterium johnsoniae]
MLGFKRYNKIFTDKIFVVVDCKYLRKKDHLYNIWFQVRI